MVHISVQWQSCSKNIHIFRVLWWWILKMQFMTITWNISVISPILNQHGLCRCFIKILCVGDWVMLTPSLYSGYFKWTSLVVSTSVFYMVNTAQCSYPWLTNISELFVCKHLGLNFMLDILCDKFDMTGWQSSELLFCHKLQFISLL